ncbi:branched-chain amino acid ABC transporter substrate-binding protein [Neorhizobium sp. P12A]|uniref:branched-chain amino acid ABC transporter substrate-binding protein n=1 Tax=Rhizobium/Agrobacterium group TaxID=227290 RepID=UPI001044B823|nr:MULTISPECIES: branched-chain amino acid ABC transporter substrate-binding protein [Rhizobium/Agrobacterium group]KAA0695552.1 branched-chain amino acid ABC transporter substrate-binding protein [Neorhizobium sp. P12A]TCR79109.1 amino acid/amide ABC transporter substrate-binding protein (HAAT family) [Rhizobium sp. BK376]
MTLKTLSGLTFAAAMALAPMAHADITIGLVAPLTGPVAAYGEQVKNGAQTAVDEINKKGGILGQKIVLKLADDAGEPKQGVSAANQLAGENIHYVVGPVTSGVAIPVSDALAENGILMVTPTATAPDLTKRGLPNVLRTCGRDDQQAEVAANYVLKQFPGKKVAIVNDKGAYGKGLADAFKATLNKGGVTEVLNDAITPGDKDFSALTTRLKAANVDVVYFGGYHPEGGLLVRQLHDLSANITLIGGDGLSNTEFWTIGTSAAAGTVFTNASDALKNPDSQAAAKALQDRNIPPEAFTLNAYAAVEVIKAGIEKVGNADDAMAVAAALKSGEPVATAIGKVTYGETGDLTSQSFSLYKWEDGKIVPAE